MNVLLTQEFRDDEASRELKQMHPKKALGLDGMSPLFYQHYWSLVGNCVTQTILDFLNHGIAPANFNETRITLVPKVKNPTKFLKGRLMIVICLTLGKVNLIIIGKTANLLNHLEKNLFLWLYTLEKEMGCKELAIDIPLVIEPVQWPECCIYRVPKKLREVNNCLQSKADFNRPSSPQGM